MYVSRERVKELTGYDVNAQIMSQAQGIVESYTGRSEARVDSADDLAVLEKATAYQAAYMVTDGSRVFEQMAVSQIGQFGQVVSFRYGDTNSPFIAPLTVIACRALSWKRSRSVKTGSIFGAGRASRGWKYE